MSQSPRGLVPAPPPNGKPWRLLILDREPGDPRWLVATVQPDRVRPAELDQVGRYTDWLEALTWLSGKDPGHKLSLVPVHDPLAWTIRE